MENSTVAFGNAETCPIVTVVCISYNQEKYIKEALNSVTGQEYPAVELIILDNGSTDATVEKIKAWLDSYTGNVKIRKLFYTQRINYCQVFNRGLSMSVGEYIIDLSGDDILLAGHIAKAVTMMSAHPDAKVYSSNALLIREHGEVIRPFFPLPGKKRKADWVPQGKIYTDVVSRYCVCTPTMVFDRQALVKEGGYNESLVYEDFDITTRMARKYGFVYGDHIGVKKRIHPQAFSQSQYRRKRSAMLISTLRVCENIYEMNQNKEEDRALRYRILHEAKHALGSANFAVATRLLSLASQLKANGVFKYWVYRTFLWLRLDISWLYEKWAKR